jgi:hypothetical protein
VSLTQPYDRPLFSEVGGTLEETPPAAGARAGSIPAAAAPTSDLRHHSLPVRSTDPDTSRFAAKVLDAENDRQVVLEALRAIGGRGTADEVWDFLDRTQPGKHWQRNAVSSRLAQLKDPRRFPAGVPVRDTRERELAPSGRPVIVFEVTGR